MSFVFDLHLMNVWQTSKVNRLRYSNGGQHFVWKGHMQAAYLRNARVGKVVVTMGP